MRKILILILMVSLTSMSSGYAATVNELVVGYLMEEYDLDPSQYQIEVLNDPVLPDITEQRSLRLRLLTHGEPLGRLTLLGEMEENGNLIGRAQIRVRVSKYSSVLVSKGRIRRNQLLNAEDFELKRMDVTSLREQPICSIDRVEGLRSKRNLRRGTILTSGAVEPVPDIEVGREVTIIFDDGMCCITVPGRPLQSGCIGDLVKVKNKSSGKIVTARVVDGSTVAVQL
ncbi:MAG: flagellar basal body P-ring formation protein FlgA [Candidatus Zixiibacteriota bacterium]|nr:MAG: flagellar basal body P-ring formation protein FlgA [candidate division Zixibacteria bacterium]